MSFRQKLPAGLFGVLALMLVFGSLTFGQVSITTPNTPVVEDFSSLGANAPATLPNGWRIDNVGTMAAPNNPNGQNGTSPTFGGSQTQTTLAATGSNNQGAAYNFGNGTNAADRAIGWVVSGNFLGPRNAFVQLRNDTGQTITSLDINFNYEKYRTGTRTTTMRFYAGPDGINWVSGVIAEGTQNFPVDTNSGTISPPAQVAKTVNLQNVNIAPGGFLYLRWEYSETGSGTRQGVGIDDISVTARTAGGGTSPTIIATPGTLQDFGNVAVGTTSVERSYTITGSNLTDNVTVTAPPEFLVSTTSGENYAPSVVIPQTSGSVSSTIYAVLAPTSTGPKSGAITNSSSGATTTNVNVSGTGSQSFVVNGQISYKTAQPLTGITVTALQNGSAVGSAVTDANGNYAISLPAGGTYTISVATAPYIFATPQQTVGNLSGNQTVNFNAASAAVFISEFRFRGTNSADEFIEIYNNTDTRIDISGFAIVSSDNGTPKYIVPGDPGSRTTTIPARGHYLIGGAGYTLGAYAAPEGVLNADIPDEAGIGLFINAASIAPAGRIDAVGFSGTGALFAEGAALNPAGGITTDAEISFVRNFGSTGYAADTDNNSADFSFVSTGAATLNGVQSILGAPGPENRDSPVFSPANVGAAIFDTGVAPTAAPNRISDPSATNNGLTPAGTLSTRTTYTNRAPLALTRFRLRIIRFSTIGSPQQYNPQAIMRALNSADITVTKSNGMAVPVKGATIEAPPNQPQAGGLNTSLIVNLGAPVGPGESINVDLTVGFVQGGRTVLNTVVEANLAAPQSASEHLVMGNPSNAVANVNAPCNYLLDKAQYAVSYCRDRGIPNWVSWHLDTSWLGSISRSDDFRADTTLPAGWYQVQGTDYSGSGFDRGHNTPSGDRTNTRADNSATFLMTNMIPQAPDNNQGPWANMENAMRDIARAGNELYIVMGGYGNGGTGSNGGTTNTIVNGRVAVPNVVFKVVIVLPVGDNDVARVTTNTRVIAVMMPNTQGIRNNDWRSYRVSVDQVEAMTGLDFFSNVPAGIQSVIESRVDNQ